MKIHLEIFSRKLSTAVLFFFIALAVQAQDYIYMKDGSEYKAKVEEITPDIIKFKKFDQPDGPLRTVKVQDVISIKYQDGTEEVFAKTIENKQVVETEKEHKTEQYVYTYEAVEEEGEPEKPKSKYELNGHDNYVSLGAGFGNSYGGAGTRFQFRKGGIVGFGLHLGLGVYTPPFSSPGTGSFQGRIMFDFGMKLFVYKWIYLDAHLGIMGRDHDYYLYDANRYSGDSGIIFGPAVMAGADYIFGKHIGLNIGAGAAFGIEGIESSGNGNGPKTKSDAYPAIDAGVFYKF